MRCCVRFFFASGPMNKIYIFVNKLNHSLSPDSLIYILCLCVCVSVCLSVCYIVFSLIHVEYTPMERASRLIAFIIEFY